MTGPTRMCRVCRTKAPQSALHRWTLQQGVLQPDQGGKAAGRGYYSCGNPRCIEILPKTIKNPS